MMLIGIIGSQYDWDVDASALFTKMTGTPNDATKRLINKLIKDYKACGYWDLCDVIVRFNLFDAQAGLLDLKNYKNATNVNGCTHTPGYGYEGDGISKVINMNYIPSTDGIKYTLNDAHFYSDIRALSTVHSDASGYGFTGFGSVANAQGMIYLTTNGGGTYNIYQRINSTGGYAMVINVGDNFFSRNSSTTAEHWVNGSKNSFSLNSSSLPDVDGYMFGIKWAVGLIQYKNNEKSYGYSVGAYLNDTIKTKVKEANDYFNANIINVL